MKDYTYTAFKNEPPIKNQQIIETIDRINDEFKEEHDIWVRVRDYQRKIEIAIMKNNIAVTIPIFKNGRMLPISLSDIRENTKAHFTSNPTKDLTIE